MDLRLLTPLTTSTMVDLLRCFPTVESRTLHGRVRADGSSQAGTATTPNSKGASVYQAVEPGTCSGPVFVSLANASIDRIVDTGAEPVHFIAMKCDSILTCKTTHLYQFRFADPDSITEVLIFSLHSALSSNG